MSGSSAILCKDCFYRYRTSYSPLDHCTHYNVSNKVTVRWNHEESRYETTDHIRPFPEHIPGHVKYVAMCDPHRGTCRQDRCTFAHGRTEQKAWNAILRGYVRNHTDGSASNQALSPPQVQHGFSPWPQLPLPYQHMQQQSQYYGQQQPVQQQPQYYGQQQPVQQQSQYFGQQQQSQYFDQRQPVQQQSQRQPVQQHFGQRQPVQQQSQRQPVQQHFGQRQPVQQQSQYFGQQQPVQQQSQYFGQQQPVQQQSQYFRQRQPMQQQQSQYLGQHQPRQQVAQGQWRQPRSYAASEETFEGRLKGELQISDIEVDLERRNYKKKFHNLICWEERRHIEILQNKCDQKYSFTIFKIGVAPELLTRKNQDPRMRYGYLSNVSNDQIDYATQASEGAFIVSQDEDRQFEVKLEILQVNNQSSDEKMYVSFYKDKTDELRHILPQPVPYAQGGETFHDVAVDFEVSHSYFNSLIRAVNNIPTEIIARILPTPADFFRLIDYPDQLFASLLASLPRGIEIDRGDQFKALHALLSYDRRSPPIIVNGSFGTGKTRLLAVITHCVIRYGISNQKPVRVLICAHHQASADNFIDQYFGTMFGGNDIELVRLTSTIYRSHSRFRHFYQTYREYIDNQRSRRHPAYLVMVTTFLTAPRLRNVFEAGFFSHIFLDEGAQSREPDAIASLCLADKNTKLVIAGDSHQVGPSLLVLGKEARENGLKLSLLERLQISYQKCGGNALKHMVSLNTNYRCHEDVMRIPNDLFYDSKIKSCSQNASLHPQATYPLLFVCSSLTSDVDHHLEANLLLNQVRRFVIDSWPGCWGDEDVKKVCLTTASQTQLVITRKIARKKFQELRYMRMVTSYNVQGQEFQAVFISTTEPVDCDGNTTNPTKSPCDPFIFNTVLTRSKSLIVAVGSPEALLQTEKHMVNLYGEKACCWSSYMKMCLEKGTFIVPPEVENNSAKREAFKYQLATELGVHQTRPSVTTRRSTASVKQSLPQTKHISATQPPTNSSVSGLSMPTENRSSRSVPTQHVETPAMPQHPPWTPFVSDSPRSPSASSMSGNHFSKRVPTQHVTTPTIPQPWTLVSSARNSESAFLQKEPPPASVKSTTKIRATPSAQHQKQRTIVSGQVSHPNTSSSTSSQRSVMATRKSTLDDTEYPDLSAAKKVSKKKGKQLAAKSQQVTVNKDQRLSISAPNITTPARHSKFYDEYKDKLSGYYPILKNEELTADNYKERFHHLLCWEEQEHDKQLAQRCNKVYDIKIFQKGFIPDKLGYEHEGKYVRYGYIDSEDSDTLVHAKQASEGSFLILDNTYIHAKHVQASPPYAANYNAIIIAFGEEQEEKLRASKFYSKKDLYFQAEVRFELKYSYFQRLHLAVYHLKQVINRLIPTDSVLYSRKPIDLNFDYTDEVEYTYPRMKLDGVQMKALKCILESHSALPVLIAGPFGTGKTRLLARAAYEMLRYENNRVLICAHHQNSVDTFVDYFGEMASNREDPWSIGMIRITPHYYRPTTKPDYDHFFKSAGALSPSDFEDNRLFITTLGISVKLFMHLPGEYSQRRDFFSHILIDEGAQTREPEIVGPLTLAGFNTKIVIAGDHCQVGPKLLVLGEEAQSNGLGASLLERLHAQYDKKQFPSKRFCSVTLLTNHRCHSGILMLPSSLYYHSTLQCGKKNDTPHHLVPFPLTFVCSDVKQPMSETSGVNEVEANMIMKEVEKYFTKWPKSWSRQEKRICIMSPSADQCSLLRNKKKKLKVDCEVEILKAYDIQGTEFPAIFISTSEPTTKDGDPINTTKSICDRYVFNTAITRSKLLVVAVGNPFLLLKMEENMIRKHDSTYKTWSPYIKQCIECETFSYAQNIDPSRFIEATHRLYSSIHSESAIQSGANPNPPSSIIKAYKEVFESIPECKDTKLILSNSKDSRLTWCIEDNKMQDMPEEEEVRYSDRYICNLRIDTFHKAEAIPYDSSKRIVKIRGLKNRKGAFDGDTVKVGVFDGNPPNKCYGRILEVKERGSDLKFICRVSPSSSIIFFPVDKKNPRFFNLPGLSRVLLRKKKGERVVKSDLESSDVVVFDPNSYDLESEEVPLPRISQVIPISVARNMLFLVSFVRWKEKYLSPLGIVIGAYCKGHTLYNAERLLKFVHSVDYTSSYNNDAPSCEAIEDQSLQLYDRAFTIDPDDAQNLDDALSITRVGENHNGHEVYQLGVHIVNAAKHIQPDTAYDKLIRSKGISVYGGEKGKIMHMLPDHNTRCQLSLTPGKVRDVISVTCKVTLNNSLNISEMDFDDSDINPAQIKSVAQLTYMDAQSIMDGDTIPERHSKAAKKFDQDKMQPSFHDSMRLLFAVAQFRRWERLQSDAAFAYDVNSTEEAFCWQSHMLVEELMIWANNEVAKRVHVSFPNAAILRKQAPPNAEQKRTTIDEDQSIMACSLYLSHYLLDGNTNASPDHEVDILIPHDTLRLLHNALRKGNKTLLAHLLSADRLYPQLAAVCSKFRSIFLRAEYCCTEENQTDAAAYRHDSLCLDNYTHFTSPMRRYVDIEIQRMLLESSEVPASRHEFSNEKQSELCINLNAKKKNASDYERKLKNVKRAIKFTASSEVYTAFISQEVKSSLEFSFPDLDLSYFPFRAKSLNITHFLPSSKESDLYVWKVRITSLKSDFAVHLLENDDFSLSEPVSSNAFNLRAFCSNFESSYLDTERYVTSQHSGVVKVSSSSWLEALEFVKNPSEDKMERVKEVLPLVPSSPSPCSLDLRKSQKRYPFFDCDVKSSLKESDVFKVWLTWTLREPVISPSIQLVEISPLLRICMQHNSHPAECFSDPNLSQASRTDYETIGDYIELWKKLLLAEAAEKSVKECQPVIIQDVLLHWPKFRIPDECIEEQYYVPTESVKMIFPEDFVEHCYEFFRVFIGSLMCVRYNCDSHHSARAVYHFVVHEVKVPDPDSKEDNAQKEIVVSMQPIGKWNCRVSSTMKEKLASEEHTCEVQIILMSPSYRRVFGGLLALGRRDGPASKLSQSVAVDRYQIRDRINYSKQAESVAGKDKLVKSLSEWTCSANSSRVLNQWQEKAMYKALCKPFQLIQGPPGTGKSVTGARIAYAFAMVNRQLKTKQCVLYCGPSNKSVDVVFEQFENLLKANKTSDLRILRIYGTAVEKNDYPGPKHETKRTSDIKCPNWAKPYALHHLIRTEQGDLQELDEQLRGMREEGKIASGKLCKKYRHVLEKAEADFLSRANVDIIFCTCNEAAGRRVGKHVSVHQCIIDECGMAYEPETIVPISKCEHAVLIGDHKQLQPVIDYHQAKENGLTTSLFERYAMRYQNEKDRAGDNRYIFTLKTQYRMHEAICEFPSEMFYDGELETDISVKNRRNNEHLEKFWPKGNRHPIMFVDVVGEEGLDKIASSKADVKVGVDSKFNLKEAELVIRIAKCLHLRHKVDVPEIAVLTPYSAQKNKLLNMVKKLPGELKKLKIASVTESQGDEYGIVILSTVRSQPLEEIRHKHYVQPDHTWRREHLGFITDKHQINVGITRSKYGLIITGNRTLLEYDSTWESLLKHYEEKHCVVNASRFV